MEAKTKILIIDDDDDFVYAILEGKEFLGAGKREVQRSSVTHDVTALDNTNDPVDIVSDRSVGGL